MSRNRQPTKLLNAIEEGDYKQVESLLQKYELTAHPLYRQDPNGWKLLNKAVTSRHPSITRLLLTKIQKVNFPLDIGEPVIFPAIERKDTKTIAVLLEFGVDLNISYDKTTREYNSKKVTVTRSTPLCTAMKSGSKEMIEFLLLKGSDPNFQDDSKRAALHFAVDNGYFEFAKLMIEKGADLNIQDKSKQTPLHLAIKRGYLELVKLLVEKGAEINAQESQDKERKTPLIDVIRGAKDIVELLANIAGDNEIQVLNLRPLHYAASNGNSEILKVLLEMNIDINAESGGGRFTPLFYAAKHQKLENVQLLLKRGARICTEGKYHADLLLSLASCTTPKILELILKHHPNVYFKKTDESPVRTINSLQIIVLLAERGFDVNCEICYHKETFTPLMHAVKRNLQAKVVNFLDAGADVNKTSMFRTSYTSNPIAYTPLYAAVNGYHNSNIVSLLLLRGANVNILPSNFETVILTSNVNREPMRDLEFIRHVALMKQQQLDVNEKIMTQINKIARCVEIYKKCEEEIAKMEAEKFNGLSLTFLDILTLNVNRLASFARNKSLTDGLKAKGEYEAKFPIYGSVVTGRLKMGLERKPLLEKATKICHNILLPRLPLSCRDEIFSYLDNREVKILINICQAAKKN